MSTAARAMRVMETTPIGKVLPLAPITEVGPGEQSTIEITFDLIPEDPEFGAWGAVFAYFDKEGLEGFITELQNILDLNFCQTASDLTDDPDVADQIEAGYSVGEAEDIVDHDEGLHNDESVPGCPRCEDIPE
jgi:hypothetical protein